MASECYHREYKAAADTVLVVSSAVSEARVATLHKCGFPPFPSIACTPSGLFAGRVYVAWTDCRYGPGNADVFLAYSDDSARTFTDPLLLTYRPDHQPQFGAQMVCDTAGTVYVAFFDTGNSPGGKTARVMLSKSVDGGLRFQSAAVGSVNRSDLANLCTGIRINSGTPEVSWSTRRGKVTVVIDDTMLSRPKDPLIVLPSMIAWKDTLRIPFKISRASAISAYLTRPLDPSFRATVFRSKRFRKGEHHIVIVPRNLALKAGSYVLTLYGRNESAFTWIVQE